MLLLLLIYVVLRALWKIDVYLISTLVNKSLYYYYNNHYHIYYSCKVINVPSLFHLPIMPYQCLMIWTNFRRQLNIHYHFLIIFAFDFCRLCVVIRIFSIQEFIYYIYFPILILEKRASIFPFECSALNKAVSLSLQLNIMF